MTNLKEIIEGFKHAKDARSVVESTWQDIVYYTNPRKRDVISETVEGEKAPADVYDATAQEANIILAAGLAGFLTNSSQRWFEFRPRNNEQIDQTEEKIWFEECTRITYDVLNDCNFYNQVHEMYLDFGPFGTGILYLEEDPVEDLRFYARHPKECYLIEDERENVRKLYRYFDMQAYAAYNFFGKDNVSEEIKKCVEEKNDFTKKFKFVHYVCPRSKRDVSKSDSLNKPFMSIWFEEKNPDKVLKESGFDEFPYFATRFYKNSCETYGYGPGHVVYSDIRMLNDMVKTYYQSAEVALFPPSLVEHDSMLGQIDFRARALNYQKQPLFRGKAIEPMLNGANFQIGLDFVNRVEEKVNKAFFVDLFLALRQTKRMTATEVMEISQERMFLLGPVIGRLQNEFLNPMLSRAFNILLRRNKFPKPPASLQGVVDFDIVHTSPLARAQRAVQTRDVNSFLMITGQMAQVIPEVLDNIDSDALIRDIHQMFSVTPKALRSEEDVNALREQRFNQQMELQQQQLIANAASVAKDAGSATKSFSEADNGRRTS